MKQTILTNTSILSQITEGKNHNLLFLPGGPGISSHYLSLMINQLTFAGTTWTIDYPKKLLETSFYQLDFWIEDIKEAVRLLNNPILIGHSFGGWMILNDQFFATNSKGIVLLNTTPSYDDFKQSIQNSNVLIDENSIIEKEYEKNPSNISLAALFKTWIPYYFSKEYLQQGMDLFNTLSFYNETYEIGTKEMSRCKCNWNYLPENILCLSGVNDKICPLETFKRHPLFNDQRTLFHEIPFAAHFPWVENLHEFKAVLENFENTCITDILKLSK